MSSYKTDALAEAQAQGFAIATDLPSNHPYWCCHHEVEWEMVGDPYERIHYILTQKPAHERQRRLHEFRPFSPSSMIAWAEYERIEGQAWAEYQRIQGTAWAEYKRINGPAWAELCQHHILDVPDTCWDGRTIFPKPKP